MSGRTDTASDHDFCKRYLGGKKDLHPFIYPFYENVLGICYLPELFSVQKQTHKQGNSVRQRFLPSGILHADG